MGAWPSIAEALIPRKVKDNHRRSEGIFHRSNDSRLKPAQCRGCSGEIYRSLIGSWFADYPALKAKQICSMPKDRGLDVSYTLVVKYTRSFRKKKGKIYHALTFLPGEEPPDNFQRNVMELTQTMNRNIIFGWLDSRLMCTPLCDILTSKLIN